MLEHLQKLSPAFATGRQGKGLARRFRRVIHVVDSSTIALIASALIASCIDWAQHRRRKAAAKLHVRLELHSLLQGFVLVESAKAADSIRAAEVSAGVKPGEIVIFDRAYVDFIHFKQIKQSLQLCDFLGNSANVVRWQVWTALLLYVLMRFLCVMSSWSHSFTRLFTLLQATL